MFKTVPWTLSGPRTTALIGEATIRNVDLTDAVFRLEVRDRRDGGELRAELDTVGSASAEGVRVISVDTSGDYPVTIIGIRINETTMEDMPPHPTDPGEDYSLWWGMHITPDGGLKFLAFDGRFNLEASTPA